jgi:predicted RNA-binding Zn-ribbon protein involved in translation (DUF1610 family)
MSRSKGVRHSMVYMKCLRKKQFESREAALAEQSSHVPYHCPFCGKWHLSSTYRKRR